MPVIDVLFSQMALTVYALDVLKSTGLGATASAVKSVPPGGSEDTLIEESMVLRSQPMDSIAVARMGRAINV